MSEAIAEVRPDLAPHLSVPLETWLAQFDSDADRALALRLFEQVRYFTLQDLRAGLRALHRWLLARPGFDLGRARFTSFAEGKSGGLIQYFYRTSNYVHHSLGLDWSALGAPPEVKSGPAETLVIMDDFIGSAREAAWYFEDAKAQLARYKERYFVTLVGFHEGIEVLARDHPEITVHCHEVHHKLFDDAYNRFTADEKAVLADFLRRYGDRVYPPARYGSIASPFGYRDGQALVAWFYNTPSNTLPIFWSVEDGWKPLFQRFDSYNVPAAGSWTPVQTQATRGPAAEGAAAPGNPPQGPSASGLSAAP